MARPKNENRRTPPIFSTRAEAAKAGEEGKPYRVTFPPCSCTPQGTTLYTVARSNMAATYQIFQHLGGICRSIKKDITDPAAAIAALQDLNAKDRGYYLEELLRGMSAAERRRLIAKLS